MNTLQFILNLIQIIVSSIAPLVAFWLGRISTGLSRKLDTANTQFENFYLPYLQMYCRGMMWEICFSELSLEARGKFLDLIMKNSHYANHALQSMIPDFYTTWLELLEFINGNPHYKSSVSHIDTLFYNFTRTVFSEYVLLCKVLRLPSPSMPPLPNDVYIRKDP